ncbi:hypothetical protein D3C81_1785210 [compost metagenome]
MPVKHGTTCPVITDIQSFHPCRHCSNGIRCGCRSVKTGSEVVDFTDHCCFKDRVSFDGRGDDIGYVSSSSDNLELRSEQRLVIQNTEPIQVVSDSGHLKHSCKYIAWKLRLGFRAHRKCGCIEPRGI